MNTNDINLKQVEEHEDIKFDENFDFNTVQKNLQQHMSENNIEYNSEKSQNNQTEYDIDTTSTEDLPSESLENQDISEFSSLLSTDDKNEDITFSEGDIIPVQSEETNINNHEKFQIKTETPKQLTEGKLKLRAGEKKYVIYIEPDNVDFIDNLTIKERKKVINRAIKYEDDEVRRKKEHKEKTKFTKQVIIMVVTVVCSLPFFFMLLNKSIELTIINYQQAQQNFIKLYKEQGKIKSYKNFKKNFD